MWQRSLQPLCLESHCTSSHLTGLLFYHFQKQHLQWKETHQLSPGLRVLYSIWKTKTIFPTIYRLFMTWLNQSRQDHKTGLSSSYLEFKPLVCLRTHQPGFSLGFGSPCSTAHNGNTDIHSNARSNQRLCSCKRLHVINKPCRDMVLHD